MHHSTSQTFQRLRKLSDSLIQAIVPGSSAANASLSSSTKRARAPATGPADSFFEYGTHGWHAYSAHLRRHPSYKNGQARVQKEDIRYPLIHHPAEPDAALDIHVESATMSAENLALRTRAPLSRAALDEQRAYLKVDAPRRGERKREEDGPYGARGGGPPKSRVREQVAPPSSTGHVPFPGQAGSQQGPARAAAAAVREKPLPKPPREPKMAERREAQRPLPVPPKPEFFTPFRMAASTRPARADQPASAAGPAPLFVPSSRTPAPANYAPAVDAGAKLNERRMERERGRQDVSEHARQRHPDVHPIPSHGDANHPDQQKRCRPERRDENLPPTREYRPADTRPAHSTPFRAQDNLYPRALPQPQPRPYPYPVTPTPQRVQPMAPLAHLVKSHRRDASPENPQRLPTPRRSSEDVRSYAPTRARDARLRVRQAEAPHKVQVAVVPEHVRGMAVEAQVVYPPRDREREDRHRREREACRRHHRERDPAREERRRLKPTYTSAVDVQYFGMADAFAREITLALAEPERATPLPLDWRAGPYVAPGSDYGVRPLATRKARPREVGAR
ncbi:hypothetical protein BD413DRAFT_493462 [Trametes elegans]|nr:hypothetical protein BD413DRAFT_493462 [Trametes elegans]